MLYAKLLFILSLREIYSSEQKYMTKQSRLFPMRFSLFFGVFLLLLPLSLPSIVSGETLSPPEKPRVALYIFSREDCAHCAKEKQFLTELKKENPSLNLQFLDITQEPAASQWKALAHLGGLSLATPITLIGDTLVPGFGTPETTGTILQKLLDENAGTPNLSPEEVLSRGTVRVVGSFGESGCSEESTTCLLPARPPLLVSVPFLGTKDVSAYSLPALSSVLGFVDGFNPCAMWVLVMFLLILSQAGSRKRMLFMASTFILAEAILYWIILNVWFTTWNFVAMDRIVTPLVGILALGGGFFFLYEWSKASGVCKIIDTKKRLRFTERIRSLAERPLGIALFLGIIALAFSVNIIEFACSIGIPQAYTKILQFNHLSFMQEQSLTALYIFFYMLDDLVVFGLALWSIDKIGLTAKYSSWTNLIGGTLMILLGFLLLLAPETLKFV